MLIADLLGDEILGFLGRIDSRPADVHFPDQIGIVIGFTHILIAVRIEVTIQATVVIIRSDVRVDGSAHLAVERTFGNVFIVAGQ